MTWRPSLGAWLDSAGAHFRLWAPAAQALELVMESAQEGRSTLSLQPEADGYATAHVPQLRAGDRYGYRVNGQGPFPDPASRFQPDGIHGLSQLVDPRSFPWTDQHWRHPPLDQLVFYEIHVGTFTPEGTFAAARARLPYLVDLGITAVELMPIADFPGQRNWGYDGVSLFAPARCYGPPDELRRLVDEGHRLGLTMFLDVVYNHFGPDGNYLGIYSKDYFTKRHHTPWGEAINFDGPRNDCVRQHFFQNALHWVHEYHFDGFRLDATHCILDDSPRHFLEELATTVRASAPDKELFFIAEDHRNLALMARPLSSGGWGMDAIWADDFHHQTRRFLAGDHEGYYRDFTGTTADLATTLQQGWFFTGQYSHHLEEPRGTDPLDLPLTAFVVGIQNHDQIGNRALGERLNHQIDLSAYRAASALLLLCPLTPLLFMGQEWASSSPFLFFTDHNDELGPLVTEGRRNEFKHFSSFTNPENRKNIPDPQSERTFTASQLVWGEVDQMPHGGLHRLYRDLLHLRLHDPILRHRSRESHRAQALSASAVAMERRAAEGRLLLVCQLRGGESHPLEGNWQPVLHTEEERYTDHPQAPTLQGSTLTFRRPAAILLRHC